jgi:hypothetical protein
MGVPRTFLEGAVQWIWKWRIEMMLVYICITTALTIHWWLD